MPSAIAAQAYGDNAGPQLLGKTIHETLYLLPSIRLGYFRLSHSSMTLSGSEARRLKIAAELKVSSAKNRLYLMDEPTPGCTSKTSKKTLGDAAEAGEQLTNAYRPGRFSAVMGIAIG
jgi:ABC-type phosphonate transport system ATPase subunit